MRRWLILLAGFAAGCQGGGTGPAGGEIAQIRLLHAAAGAPSLDLLVGGQVAVSGVGYQQVSQFREVPAGGQTLALRSTGGAAILTSLPVMLGANQRHTLLVSGSAAQLSSRVTVDTGLAKPDRANIRFINIAKPVSQDSASRPPPVYLDLYVTNPGAGLDGLSPILSLDATVPSYSTLIYFDPGSYVARFTSAGTKTEVAATVAFAIAAGEVKAVTLERLPDGTYRTAVVTEP